MVRQSYHADRWSSLLPGNGNRDVCVFPRILRVSASRPAGARIAAAAGDPAFVAALERARGDPAQQRAARLRLASDLGVTKPCVGESDRGHRGDPAFVASVERARGGRDGSARSGAGDVDIGRMHGGVCSKPTFGHSAGPAWAGNDPLWQRESRFFVRAVARGPRPAARGSTPPWRSRVRHLARTRAAVMAAAPGPNAPGP